uniref:RNA-dependent RNA polymerase n=1 Tax=Lentinula edodes magoulivirus virus 1 TaxID=2778989 RepID=A0A7S6Z359_9VIRU|nr:RNA-dependent RNA polymerase [Lentinula edodes magoulivirus virus 1]
MPPQDNKLNESNWKSLRGLLSSHFSNKNIPLPHSLPHPDDLTLFGTCLPDSVSNEDLSSRWSAFLFRKALRKKHDKEKQLDDFFEKVSQTPLESESYMRHCARVVNDLFPQGWDRHYGRAITNYNLKDGSTVEFKQVDDWDLDVYDFHGYCLGNKLPDEAMKKIKARMVTLVPDGNKLRTVTVSTKWQHLLAPLHHIIYDQLTSRKDSCVLRGDPTVNNMPNFLTKDGEFFVSGDYEASTDNLSSKHSEYILHCLRTRSEWVPQSIWDLAIASLTGEIFTVNKDMEIDRHGYQRTGQLMGNFLSFPLLCIANIATLYAADVCQARWMLQSKLVKINGDDIAYRSNRSFYEKWMAALPTSGFVINKIKTGLHRSVFTINSKIFRAGTKRVKQVWHLCPAGIYAPADWKISDKMAAVADVIRENIKGAGHKYKPLWRNIAKTRNSIWIRANCCEMSLHTLKEYKASPRDWKAKERVSSYELYMERYGRNKKTVEVERNVGLRERNTEGMRYVRKTKVDGIIGSVPKEGGKRYGIKLHSAFCEQLQVFNRHLKRVVKRPFRELGVADFEFQLDPVYLGFDAYKKGNKKWRKVLTWIGA